MSDLPTPQFPYGSSTGETARDARDTRNESANPAPVKRKTPRPVEKVDLNNLPDLLTISEVSGLLRVSPLTIKRWGKRGKLPAIRINSRGDRRYKKQAVLWMLGMTENE
ncbi:MAG: hypothetical protein A2804_01020 [Candidatus Pacebacteria bacterium RIFCSPHIGHO2_01_FULL_46_10]|nr:MAG: hypothetical protein A2804_01020 [Candidatus Pacebacteria bacterium RIFCSPHIGHO2_01_FULL_46_10]